MTARVLSDRELGRATLARQLLLRRSDLTAVDAVRHLVGLQAQAANAPYLGLWSRLEPFAIDTLSALLAERRVVRAGSLRGTQHLTTADDYLWLRPLTHAASLRQRRSGFGRRTAGVDLEELAEVAGDLLAGRTLTRPELRGLLAERFPGRDAEALAWSTQCLLWIVHPPPTGLWRTGGATRFALAEEWIGRPVTANPDPATLVRRYLAAYGPATVRDVQTFSGLTRLRDVMERMPLRTFRDERGALLYDVPDAPLPGQDVPAPVRLLPEFDNLVLAHADRRRLMSDADRERICVGSLVCPTVLVDGRVAGTWRLRRDGPSARVVIHPHRPLGETEREAVAAEADRLLAFAAPEERGHEVVFGS
ncbi:winged helix DNA-binding domain-containing protein [Actinoallomurus acaciae]|uniref:Winged helix DNA-binding domain-containing protein n=1 Tax=Actinoallomurus acaciae TaxID=502577 RepID=A0ABV5YCD6_9ACTN